MPGHKRQIIKVRKRRLNLSKYRIYVKVPMSFFVVVKGCVNFHEMTSVRLREFRGLAPKSFLGGAGPQNLLTMVIILPPSAAVSPPPIN